MHEWIAYTYLCNIHTYLCKHTYFCNLEIAYSSGPELQVAYNLCANGLFNYQQLSKTIIPN